MSEPSQDSLLQRLSRIEAILQLFTPEEIEERLQVRRIQTLVAEYFDLSRLQLLARGKRRRFSHPRQLAMALVAEAMPQLSHARIGRAFGHRDPSTVLHAIHRVAERCADPRFRNEHDTLRRAVKRSAITGTSTHEQD